jgi:hypothetical protein
MARLKGLVQRSASLRERARTTVLVPPFSRPPRHNDIDDGRSTALIAGVPCVERYEHVRADRARLVALIW